MGELTSAIAIAQERVLSEREEQIDDWMTARPRGEVNGGVAHVVTNSFLYVCVYTHMYVCMCVCVCHTYVYIYMKIYI